MKIAQIVSTPPFAWTTGGPARVVYEASLALVHKKHRVTIITTAMFREDISYNQETLRNSVNGVDFKYFNNVSSFLAWKYKIYFSVGLVRYLRDHIPEYDIVHLHDLISFHAVATMFLCQKNGIPYILSPHGCINWFFEDKLLNKVFYSMFGKKILENAKIITLLHPSEVEEFTRLGVPSGKCVTIPNGIDPSLFENTSRAGQFRDKYHVPLKEKIVFYLGRINKIKGIALLIRAFSDLPKELEVKLVIAGRDEGYLPELKLLSDQLNISQRVIFTGPLSEEEKIDAYIDADVFVLPSVHEGFGITVLEAIASGTPVIVTKGCHISDSVQHSALVIDHDMNQLTSALVTLLTNTAVREERIAKGYDLIKKEYSWDTITGQYEKVYRQIIAQNAHHGEL